MLKPFMLKPLKPINLISTSLITLLFVALSQTSFAAEQQTSKLETLITRIQTMPSYIELDARLEAINLSTISAQTSGIVEVINVDINDHVTAGQTLILINDSQQQAQLSQAKANVAQAQALNEDAQILLKRNRSLLAKKTLSQGEFDSSIAKAKSTQAAVLAAQAAAKQAQEQLSYTHIKAPYAGIVSQRMVQVGELVNPGQALMVGFAPQPLRAVVDIPQRLTKHLNTSMADKIYIQTQDQRFSAKAITLYPYADNRFSSVRARVELPTNNHSTNNYSTLMPGSWVKVALPSVAREGIYVPVSAVLQQGEVAKLFIKDERNDQFKLRYIRLGQRIKSAAPVVDDVVDVDAADGHSVDLIEVSAGLESNEEVAVHAIEAAKSIRSGL